MSSDSLPYLHEALDAEIQRVEGLNYAKASFGLLPIYDFPLEQGTHSVPAVQLHGVWFRVNPVSKEALNAETGRFEKTEILQAENALLVARLSQMQEEMEKLQVELASVRNRRELEQRVMNEERKEIAGLRLELESLKRRQSGNLPRLFRNTSGASAPESPQHAASHATAAKTTSSETTSQVPSVSSSPSITPSPSAVRLSNGVSSGPSLQWTTINNEKTNAIIPAPQLTQTPSIYQASHKRHRESLKLAGYVLPAEEEEARMPWEKSN